jgi:uncharacterized membrane protein YhdT
VVYCERCGKWENRCEEECGSGKGGSSVFWAVIVILIGCWILFEFGLKNVKGLPDWVYSFEVWWIIPVVIGIAIIAAGIKMIMKKDKKY